MLGFVVMLMKFKVDASYWNRAFSKYSMNIPRVPGVGLLLEKPFFVGYNMKMSKLDQGHELVELSNDVQKKVDEFKETVIYKTMMRQANETKE
jgi:tRNA U38,U39,U40 pseudouridine synthase TruA